MSGSAEKFVITAAVVVVATAGGYLCRRRQWVGERVAEWIMTMMAVAGYPAAAFLTIWGTALRPADVMLPVLAVVHGVAMAGIALATARVVTRERAEKGLFAVASGLGNNGFTMGAFVLYLLYGEEGMGLGNLYFLLGFIMVVVFFYPLARHYAAHRPAASLAQLLRHSLLDWRAIGLPFCLAAIVLSAAGVPRPAQVVTWHVVDWLVYTVTPVAFFGIGLRLHLSHVLPLARMLTGLAVMRFVVGAAVGLGLAALTSLTPWGLHGLRWNVFIIESFVPTAVTMVAIANMFELHPRSASVLFVVNTAFYVLLVLPLVFWLFA